MFYFLNIYFLRKKLKIVLKIWSLLNNLSFIDFLLGTKHSLNSCTVKTKEDEFQRYLWLQSSSGNRTHVDTTHM